MPDCGKENGALRASGARRSRSPPRALSSGVAARRGSRADLVPRARSRRRARSGASAYPRYPTANGAFSSLKVTKVSPAGRCVSNARGYARAELRERSGPRSARGCRSPSRSPALTTWAQDHLELLHWAPTRARLAVGPTGE